MSNAFSMDALANQLFVMDEGQGGGDSSDMEISVEELLEQAEEFIAGDTAGNAGNIVASLEDKKQELQKQLVTTESAHYMNQFNNLENPNLLGITPQKKLTQRQVDTSLDIAAGSRYILSRFSDIE